MCSITELEKATGNSPSANRQPCRVRHLHRRRSDSHPIALERLQVDGHDLVRAVEPLEAAPACAHVEDPIPRPDLAEIHEQAVTLFAPAPNGVADAAQRRVLRKTAEAAMLQLSAPFETLSRRRTRTIQTRSVPRRARSYDRRRCQVALCESSTASLTQLGAPASVRQLSISSAAIRKPPEALELVLQ